MNSFFWEAFWKSAVMLGAALLMAWLLRRKPASLRHLVLSAGLAATLAGAVPMLALPRWTKTVPAWVGTPAPTVISEPPAAPKVFDDQAVAYQEAPSIAHLVTAPAPAPVSAPPRIHVTVAAIWFLGVMLVLARLAAVLFGLRRSRKSALAVADEELQSFVARAASEIGIRRRIPVLRNSRVEVPVAWGLLRPVILVPEGFTELPAPRRDAVLYHELAHIQRRDPLTRVLAELACALLWFQPLAWVARRKIREEQELACDDCVLARGEKPSSYAGLLLEWHDRVSGKDQFVTAGMAGGSCFKRRLRAILDPGLGRAPVSSAAVIAVWIAGLALALPLGALTFARALAPALRLPLPVTLPMQVATPVAGAPNAPAPVQASVPPEETASITGKVLNDFTGEPIMKAAVIVSRLQSDSSPALVSVFSALTDASGAFLMTGLDPGVYRINAERSGFIASYYGATSTEPRGATITLTAAQRLSSLDFKLKPHGVIAGRIVNADGEPVADAVVVAQRPGFALGARGLVFGASGVTNDLGEYRLINLPPAKYFVTATFRASAAAAAGEDRSAKPSVEGYVGTFYPGTVNLETAASVDVQAGSVVQGIDVKLKKIRLSKVRGRVLNQTGVSSTIRMDLQPEGAALILVTNPPTVGPEGQFEFRNVVPGLYRLSAQVMTGGNSGFRTVQPVDVGNDPLENITLTLMPGFDIPGNFRVEDGSADVRGIHLSLFPGKLLVAGTITPGTSQPDDQGNFKFTNVNPDHYTVRFDGLPKGSYIKSIRIGREDGLENGIEPRGPGAPMEIVLSMHAGQLSGAVTDEKDRPVERATVVLVPQDAQHRTEARWYQNTTADSSGRFTLDGLTPGAYKLFAWVAIPSRAWMDPDVLRRAESKGKAVTVREGSLETVDLMALPAVE